MFTGLRFDLHHLKITHKDIFETIYQWLNFLWFKYTLHSTDICKIKVLQYILETKTRKHIFTSSVSYGITANVLIKFT